MMIEKVIDEFQQAKISRLWVLEIEKISNMHNHLSAYCVHKGGVSCTRKSIRKN